MDTMQLSLTVGEGDVFVEVEASREAAADLGAEFDQGDAQEVHHG